MIYNDKINHHSHICTVSIESSYSHEVKLCQWYNQKAYSKVWNVGEFGKSIVDLPYFSLPKVLQICKFNLTWSGWFNACMVYSDVASGGIQTQKCYMSRSFFMQGCYCIQYKRILKAIMPLCEIGFAWPRLTNWIVY